MSNKTCSVEGCKEPYHCSGFCNYHYLRTKLGKPLDKPKQHRNCGIITAKNRDGYYKIRRGGKTRTLHRVVMEEFLGRPLLTTEDVHHINGVRTDNRPENLQVISRSEHMALHKTLYPIVDGMKECGICHVVKPIDHFYKRSENTNGATKRHSWCKPCQNRIRVNRGFLKK